MTIKADRFIVHSLKPCSRCKASGWVENPIYAKHDEWKADFIKRNNFAPTKMEIHSWWADQGYPKGFPDDPEGPCPDCKGQGVTSEDIDLFDAIKALDAIDNCERTDPTTCTCGHHHVIEDKPA